MLMMSLVILVIRVDRIRSTVPMTITHIRYRYDIVISLFIFLVQARFNLQVIDHWLNESDKINDHKKTIRFNFGDK
jgi:hypothetical protein